MSDVSPLASLRSLEGVAAWNTSISDFSALANLPRLQMDRIWERQVDINASISERFEFFETSRYQKLWYL